MSGWSELAALGVTVRPIIIQPGRGYVRSQFSAPFRTTIQQLARELRQLDATNIVLELDITERNIRADGLPRADARLGNPSVVLAFDSRHGPLRYATGEYDDWQDNLRAIALSMEALRAVDRYGVSKRGEQYAGWKALPASTDRADSIHTREQAERFLEQWGGDWKRAVRETHPDVGGDPAQFRQVMRAKELVSG